MLRKVAAAALTLSMLTMAAAAASVEETGAGKDQTAPPLSFLRFASVIEAGSLVEDGDLIKLQRSYSNWTLRCDIRLSKNRRVCFIEQRGDTHGTPLVWRIGMNTANRPVAVIALPADFNAAKGLRMKFSGLEKTLGKENFVCSPQSCIGGFLFEGFVQEAITKSADIGFVIPRLKGEPVSMTLSMTGFTEALDAGARDPFGRDGTSDGARKRPVRAKSRTKDKYQEAISQRQEEKARQKSTSTTAGQSSGGKKVGLF